MKAVNMNETLVFHFRVKKGDQIQSRAGATVVFQPDSRRFGVALCCPMDHYRRQWGRKIAKARLVGSNRSRVKRFDCNPRYDGLLDIEHIRTAAGDVAWNASRAVGNIEVRDSLVVGDDNPIIRRLQAEVDDANSRLQGALAKVRAQRTWTSKS